MDVIWYHWFIRSPLIVKVSKVNFSQNVSPELNESSCVTYIIITQVQAEDEAHTESNEVSEEHLVTESHSDQHLEPPSSGLTVPVCPHCAHVFATLQKIVRLGENSLSTFPTSIQQTMDIGHRKSGHPICTQSKCIRHFIF